MIDDFRDHDVGQQSWPDAVAGHDLGGRWGLRELRIVPGRLVGAANVGGAGHLSNEQRRRAVVEPFLDFLAEAGTDCRAARAAFLGVDEI
jgi:hypothetical protein